MRSRTTQGHNRHALPDDDFIGVPDDRHHHGWFVDKDGDAHSEEFDCPTNIDDMMKIVHSLRQQREERLAELNVPFTARNRGPDGTDNAAEEDLQDTDDGMAQAEEDLNGTDASIASPCADQRRNTKGYDDGSGFIASEDDDDDADDANDDDDDDEDYSDDDSSCTISERFALHFTFLSPPP
jgi:hypothetical protein